MPNRYSAMACINLSIKRGEVCGPGGGAVRVEALGVRPVGLC
jgi:hypothetical protein